MDLSNIPLAENCIYRNCILQVLGRDDDVGGDREGRAEGAASSESLSMALNQLESGILMVSSLRQEDGCAQRLACKLGDIAKENVSK